MAPQGHLSGIMLCVGRLPFHRIAFDAERVLATTMLSLRVPFLLCLCEMEVRATLHWYHVALAGVPRLCRRAGACHSRPMALALRCIASFVLWAL